MSKFTRSDLIAAGYTERLPGQWFKGDNSITLAKPSKPQIRMPRRREPNKTEQRWRDEQGKTLCPDADWFYEAISFRLPSGTLYTPDWTGWDGQFMFIAVEVKGAHIHNSRSTHAFKEARSAWSRITWLFAQWKNGHWLETNVPPG